MNTARKTLDRSFTIRTSFAFGSDIGCKMSEAKEINPLAKMSD